MVGGRSLVSLAQDEHVKRADNDRDVLSAREDGSNVMKQSPSAASVSSLNAIVLERELLFVISMVRKNSTRS